MIVIDKANSSSDQAIGSNCDSPPSVELAAGTNECSVADDNRRARLPDTIELELNPSLESAGISNRDLVRPTHMQFRQVGSCANVHSLR